MSNVVLNLLFGCRHKRITRPMTPVSRKGVPETGTYVVCLDCGKQFAYDLNVMRVGKPLEAAPASGVASGPPKPPNKFRYAAAAAAMSIGFVIRRVVNGKKPARS